MNIKKKIVTLITSAACAVSCMAFGISPISVQNEADAAGLSGLTATQITSQMKIGWNLGNSLDSTSTALSINSSPQKFATAWGNPEPTEDQIDAVNKAGFNTIRIPVTWYQHLYQENGEYKINDTWMAYVKKIVDYAYERDMFIILNMHHEDFINVSQFTDATYNDASAKLTDIWTRLSEEFKDYDQHLIFEGMNEPRETGNPSNSEWGDGDNNSWNYINKLNKVFIDVVRGQGSANNKERLLMLPGYHAGNSAVTIRAIDVPSGSGNVALSVHAYNPYFFCMATDNYANHTYPGKSGYGADYKSELQTMFNSFKSIMNEKNVPIILGEFSASDFNNTDSRINWAKDYLSMAKEAGIPCVLWDNNVVADGTKDNGEAHGYLYRLTSTWYPNSKPVIAAMMDTVGVTNYELPDYKEYVAPPFSWDNIKIGDDWEQLYYYKDGNTLTAWTPDGVQNFQKYMNKNYVFAMVYDASIDPALVLQTSTGAGGWYYVLSDNANNKRNVLFYTYDDIINVLNANNDSLDKVNNLFVSAHSGDATIYGLYAVPVGSENPTESTEPSTEESTEQPVEIIAGDMDGNKIINIYDLILMKRMYINVDASGPSGIPPHACVEDVDGDGRLTITDIVTLAKFLTGQDVALKTYQGTIYN